jgi:putative transposase
VGQRDLRTLLGERPAGVPDHLLIMSDRQLHRVIKEYVDYYNRARPHQGLGRRIPEGSKEVESEKRLGKIISFPVLGGLHHD